MPSCRSWGTRCWPEKRRRSARWWSARPRHAIALNHRISLGPSLWTKRGRAQRQALALPPHTAQRREESLELLTWLTTRIDQLDAQIAAAAAAEARAQLLLTHPGVDP